MKVWLSLLASFALSTLVLAQQPTFRAGTQVVSLFATVTDAQKRLVPDLQQADFEVFDNEKSQPLVFFQNEVQPITVMVMLDTSGSMTLTLVSSMTMPVMGCTSFWKKTSG